VALVASTFISSVLISCKYESAFKLFLVHINLGNYWINPIRQSQCSDPRILVESSYSNVQFEFSRHSEFELCPEESPFINQDLSDSEFRFENISRFDSETGVNKPIGCQARQRTAVIVPYRNRPDQLEILINHLNPILQLQQLEYQIFIVNQEENTTFSRARLMNAGVQYLENNKNYTWDCYVFHDVDLLIESPKGLYKCLEKYPRHLSSSIDKYHYTVPWNGIVGGAMAFTPDQFRKVNGYSNEYWGWGCEDDDMFVRIVHSCYNLEQADNNFYRYKMIIHAYEKSYKGDSEINDYFRFTLATTAHTRQNIDGMSNLDVITKLSSSLPNRTFVSAWIGSPDGNIRIELENKYQNELKTENTTCMELTPVLFLFSVHLLAFTVILSLARYMRQQWSVSQTESKFPYEKIDPEKASLHSFDSSLSFEKSQ